MQSEHLEEDAPEAPEIHLVVIVPIREEALRRPVSAGRNILGVRLLGVDPSTGPIIG